MKIKLKLVDEVHQKIVEATEILRGIVHKTPLDKTRTFSMWTGGEVYLKLENLQKTGSFKVRGAYYKIYKLISKGKVKKVVAVSAGNHAQGVAWAASKAKIESIIFMPEFAPAAKISATRGYGAKVILYGRTIDDSYAKAIELAEQEDVEFIHPFNDLDVIAGQGTIGVEILEQLPDAQIVVVPIGGGGLISGIATAIKKRRPDVKVIGVEAKGAASMYESLKLGRIVKLRKVDTIADGIAIKSPGEYTFQLVKELVDDIVTVDDFEISDAMFKLLERAKVVAEPAGAVSAAALLSGKINVKGKKVVAVVSGGNVDASLLATILEKSLMSEGRVIRMIVELPDKPGTLKKVLGVIAEARANILDVAIDRISPQVKPGKALVLITAEVQDPDYVDEVMSSLKKLGYTLSIL
ncbi:MAG: threonine ammonia-lyase [Candidatus Methanomethylicota archaeon]|uniref:threonine ammonia-lyase n=2 Tax=Thermoproteota archaeon TaxID=2056631 RepID=A0A497F6X8_9CREN|nr:MAG: threonine ammonia-lyase [Candidatus Verstraetearchaeota archaeon]